MQITITRPHFSNDPAPPVDWHDIDGVVFTGSGVYWSADEDEAASARKIMEAAFKSSLPVFGSCYGMQLGVAVLGGRIRANPLGSEIAIARDIQINDTGEKHALYKNKPTLFDALCMHRDEVQQTGYAVDILSGNSHCAIQAVAAKALSGFGECNIILNCILVILLDVLNVLILWIFLKRHPLLG